jgi:DNA transformation protein
MARHISSDDSFVEHICDQIASLDGISHRSMFGGFGLYCGSTFFGIAYRGHLYLKTDEDSRAKYLDWEMEPFQANAKQSLRSYYEVPEDCIDDAERLTELADEAITVVAGG